MLLGVGDILSAEIVYCDAYVLEAKLEKIVKQDLKKISEMRLRNRFEVLRERRETYYLLREALLSLI